MRAFITISFVLFFAATNLCAQPFATVGEYETAIQQEFAKDTEFSPDSVKAGIHATIEELFASVLLLPDAFTYRFDSLKRVGRITSNDEKVRMFTWELVRQDGSHYYYGFVLCRRLNPEHSLVIKLTGNNANITDPGLQTLDQGNWFGALYYDIIESRWEGHPLYTLLGFDPNTIFTARKVIDCFYLKDGTIAVFGAPIFIMENKVRNRVLFEYSARVSMSLRYDDKHKRIVFDHLSPSKPSYEGNFEFYGPDFSYDAFNFVDNTWVLQENIDIRNKE